jgi:levansucrase
MPTLSFYRRALLVLLALAVLPACDSEDPDPDDADCPPIEASITAEWTEEAAESITRTAATTIPVIDASERPDFAPDLWVWDTWPLRDRDGSVAVVDGYYVNFSLTAPDDVLPGARHGIAEIRYFYSTDGENWELGGRVFTDGDALGQKQWAGSALYDNGEVYLYYTASGADGGNVQGGEGAGLLGRGSATNRQEIALATGAELVTGEDGVSFEGAWTHTTILTADGDLYQTYEQSIGGIIYAFRDPWFYEDPYTGETYLLFTANTPIDDDTTYPCDPVMIGGGDYASGSNEGGETLAYFNGSVGIARSPSGDPTQWELLPPLMEGLCVNQQLERAHIVNRDDQYYLFFSSHKFTFAEQLTAPADGFPDGLYGFVSDCLRSEEYRPLNGSGLVLNNPLGEPFQTYSYLVLPDFSVISYFNYFNLGGIPLNEVGAQPEEFQFSRFAGTQAPTLRLGVNGTSTQITEVLGFGVIPESATRSSSGGALVRGLPF